jgi:hypothetical protein
MRREKRVSPKLCLLIFDNDDTNCMCARIMPDIYKLNREKVNQVRIFNQLGHIKTDIHSDEKRFSSYGLKWFTKNDCYK